MMKWRATGAGTLLVVAAVGCSYDDEADGGTDLGPATTMSGTYAMTINNGVAAPPTGPGSSDMVFSTDGSAVERLRRLSGSGEEITTSIAFQYRRRGSALYLEFGPGHVDTSTVSGTRIDVLEANTDPRESRSYERQ